MSHESKISKNKKLLLIILVLVGLVLIFSSSYTPVNTETDSDEYINQLEKKLEDFLLNVDGINKVKVIITLDSSMPDVENKGYYSKTDTTLPYVRGVVIACTNGGSDYVKAELTDIVSKYLGIGANKVKITDIKG